MSKKGGSYILFIVKSAISCFAGQSLEAKPFVRTVKYGLNSKKKSGLQRQGWFKCHIKTRQKRKNTKGSI